MIVLRMGIVEMEDTLETVCNFKKPTVHEFTASGSFCGERLYVCKFQSCLHTCEAHVKVAGRLRDCWRKWYDSWTIWKCHLSLACRTREDFHTQNPLEFVPISAIWWWGYCTSYMSLPSIILTVFPGNGNGKWSTRTIPATLVSMHVETLSTWFRMYFINVVIVRSNHIVRIDKHRFSKRFESDLSLRLGFLICHGFMLWMQGV